MRPRLKHRIEYRALILLERGLRPLPHRVALCLAWVAAGVAFHGLRFRRRETLRRIRAVLGPDLPARTVRRIAWRSLRNTFFNAVEMLQSPRASLPKLRARIDGLDTGVATLQALLRRHGGLVVAIPHMGNWDQAGIACTLAGVPVFSIAARQRNLLVNALIHRLRRGPAGMDILERGGALTMRLVLRRLRSGQALAILPDVRMRHPDLPLPFLGATCNLGRGMAQFARGAGVPILPILVTRQGWRKQRMRCLDPVHPDPELDKSADHVRITRFVMAQVEQTIRAEPEQWFWYNRRWIADPVVPEPSEPEEPNLS